MTLSAQQYEELIKTRVFNPGELTAALVNRSKRTIAGADGKLLMIAADHTARGKIALGDDPLAMADRFTLLDRLLTCLEMPEVDGVLASADVLEELAWLGALDGKLAIGTMNRGGIIGANWELDDRLSAYDSEHIMNLGLDGGKLLLRFDYQDERVPRTIESVARSMTELADHKLMTMVAALPYTKNSAGMAVLDSSHEALVKVVAIASGLGAISAHTWLKLPPTPQMAEVAAATSLPILMLGGEPKADGKSIFDQWRDGMKQPNVRGVIAGRTLLYPMDGDSSNAVRLAHQAIRGESR